jgi:hypothetical protein
MLRYLVGMADIRLTNDMNSIAIGRFARPKVKYAVQTRSEAFPRGHWPPPAVLSLAMARIRFNPEWILNGTLAY